MIRQRDGACQVIVNATTGVDRTLSFDDVDAFAAMNVAIPSPRILIEHGRLEVSAAMARLAEPTPLRARRPCLEV